MPQKKTIHPFGQLVKIMTIGSVTCSISHVAMATPPLVLPTDVAQIRFRHPNDESEPIIVSRPERIKQFMDIWNARKATLQRSQLIDDGRFGSMVVYVTVIPTHPEKEAKTKFCLFASLWKTDFGDAFATMMDDLPIRPKVVKVLPQRPQVDRKKPVNNVLRR